MLYSLPGWRWLSKATYCLGSPCFTAYVWNKRGWFTYVMPDKPLDIVFLGSGQVLYRVSNHGQTTDTCFWLVPAPPQKHSRKQDVAAAKRKPRNMPRFMRTQCTEVGKSLNDAGIFISHVYSRPAHALHKYIYIYVYHWCLPAGAVGHKRARHVDPKSLVCNHLSFKTGYRLKSSTNMMVLLSISPDCGYQYPGKAGLTNTNPTWPSARRKKAHHTRLQKCPPSVRWGVVHFTSKEHGPTNGISVLPSPELPCRIEATLALAC